MLCSRTRAELSNVLAAITAAGGDAIGRVMDIGSAAQSRSLVDLAVRRCGRLDILINNAGILGPRVSLIEYPVSDWKEVVRINLSGTFYLSQRAAAHMAARRSGCIITVSSSVGRAGRAKWGAYAVSKFGVEGLSQVMADELGADGVCVITYNPGGTRTQMREAAYPAEDPAQLYDPFSVARDLLHLSLACTPAMSGRAFNRHTVPRRSAGARRIR